MPNKCCVPNCKTNYASCVNYTPVFRFPSDENLKKQWFQNIPRKDWESTKWAVVCVKHFAKDMILSEEIVKNINGSLKKIVKKKLKTNAVPRIFPGLTPDIEDTEREECRNSELHEATGLDLQGPQMNDCLQNDLIADFVEFCEKLPEKERIYISWNVHRDINFVLFYSCDFNGIRPKIVSSIKISNDMTCNVVVNMTILIKSQLKWILPQNVRITRRSQIKNILTRYKKDNTEKLSETMDDMVSLINTNFLHLLDTINHDVKYSATNTSNQLKFLLEQFNLIFAKSHRYSIKTKIWSFMILMQSVSALIIREEIEYTEEISKYDQFDTIFDTDYLSAEIDYSSLFYISGYVAFKMSTKICCATCLSLLLSSDCDVTDTYFQQISRGNLKVPSELLVLIGHHIVCLMQKLISAQFEKLSLSVSNQRNLLISLGYNSILQDCDITYISKEHCGCGMLTAKTLKHILQHFSNILINNYVKLKNNIHFSSSKQRKLQTLKD